jgi:uncharacterized protein YbjT (DUF2867 family)
MFVVLGATGHTGSVVAETLLARKQPVRVVVRSAEAAKLFEEMYTSFSKGTIGYEQPASLVRGTVILSEALRGMV